MKVYELSISEDLPATQRLSTKKSGVIESPEPIQVYRSDPEGPAQEGAEPNQVEADKDRATPGRDCSMMADSLPAASGRRPIQRTISSAPMFMVLVEDITESSNVGHVEAWLTTIKALFAEAYNAVPV